MQQAEDFTSERKLAAIMFTDMVGFTALTQRDERHAMELLDEQMRLVRSVLPKYKGREIKTIGDAFLVEFASSLDAVTCAIAIQTALEKINSERPDDRSIRLRIGIHLGDVIHQGADLAGDAVNIASRIEALALPGGICLTAPVHASVLNKVNCSFDSLGFPDLKNVTAPVEVFRVKSLGIQTPGLGSPRASSSRERIAILPFRNFSAASADEYLADGLTEELISSVSRMPGLRVIARTSVMRYKGTSETIAEIGRQLKVGKVVEGSVRKAGEKVRISVQLVDTSDEEPRWSREYDRELRDVLSIQSDIARSVANALQVQVLGTELEEGKATSNTEAYVSYLRGRQFWNKRTEADLKRAIGFFEAALALDPNYAQAYSGLADSYAALALLEFMAPKDAYPKATAAAEKAVTLRTGLADAHTSLGLVKFQYDWNWPGAENEFREAININPNYAPAHQFFADYLKAMGRFDEAINEIEKAQELDPLSLAINTAVGHVFYLSRQYDHAIEQYQRAVDLDPGFMATHIWFGRPYLEKGMYAEAISELETAVMLSGESTLALAMLGHGLASAGRENEANHILEKLADRAKTRYVPSYWIAVVYNGFRDKEQVIRWMWRAFEERSSWLVWSNVEPRFDWLRGDAEFDALLKAMNFP